MLSADKHYQPTIFSPMAVGWFVLCHRLAKDIVDGYARLVRIYAVVTFHRGYWCKYLLGMRGSDNNATTKDNRNITQVP